MAEIPKPEVAQKVIDSMEAFLNRAVRYPICHQVLTPLARLPITPNQVSFFHAFLGCVAAYYVAQGHYAGLVTAVILYELRMILDCFDGVLARLKNMTSVFGRYVDELSDTTSFVGLLICSGIHLSINPSSIHLPFELSPLAGNLLIGFLIGALGAATLTVALVHELLHLKISSTLKTGRDSMREEWETMNTKVQSGKASALERLGYRFDCLKLKILFPSWYHEYQNAPDQRDSVHQLLEKRETPEFKKLTRMVAFCAGDNVLMIVHIGMLLDQLFLGMCVAVLSALIMLFSALIQNDRFFSRQPLGANE